MSVTSAPSLPTTVVLVVNPHGGKYRRLAGSLPERLSSAGFEVRAHLEIGALDDLQRWLDEPAESRPMVVVAGGDGSVGSVANRLACTDTVMGILPLGTNNDAARSLGIPDDLDSAIECLRRGSPSTVDAGMFEPQNGQARYFVQAATLGLQVTFARLASRSSWRQRLGRFTYVVATLAALRRRRPFDCVLVMDGQRFKHRLVYLAVINAPIFGGPLELRLPGAGMDNQRLDVLAVDDLPIWRLLLAPIPLLLHRDIQHTGVHVFHTAHLRVETRDQFDVALDGEIAGKVPATFALSAGCLKVARPPATH